MSDNKVEISIGIKSEGATENANLTKILQEQQKTIEQLTKSLGGLAEAQGKLSSQAADDAAERANLRKARAAKEAADAIKRQANERKRAFEEEIRDSEKQEKEEARLEAQREKRASQESARIDKMRRQREREQDREKRDQDAQLSRQARLALLPAIGVSGASLGSVGQAGLGIAGSLGLGGGAASGAGVLGGILATIGPIGIAAAAAAIGIGVLAKEITGLVVSEAAGARELQNFAIRLDISMAAAQRLQIAARLTGIEISGLEASSRVLANALEDPAGQGKKAADSLHQLGIALNDSQGEVRQEGAVLLELLQKLSQLPTAAERFEIASRTLGRQAKVLAPLLADAGLLKSLLEQDGQGFDAANQKLLAANKRVLELENTWAIFKKELAAEVAPIVIPVFYVIHSLIGGTTGEVNLKPYKLKAPKPPDWEETYKNAFQTQGIVTPEQSAANAYKDKEYKTDPDYVQGLLSAKKKENEDLRLKLNDPNLALNKRKDFEAKLKEGVAAEQRIRDHYKSFEQIKREENGILEALRRLELQTQEAESWNDPDAALKARHDSFVQNLTAGFAGRDQGLNKQQLRQVDSNFERQEAAGKAKRDNEEQRAADAERFRLDQEHLKRQQEYEDHVARAGFSGRDTTKGSIDDDARRAVAARQELLKQDEAQIRLHQKNAQEGDKAVNVERGKAANDIDAIAIRQKTELFDLNERIKKQDEEGLRQIRGVVRSDNRTQIGKDFEQTAKLSQLRAGFGEKPFAEVEARQKQLELARQLFQMDLEDAALETDSNKKALDIVKAILDLKDKDRQAEREHEQAVAEYQKAKEEKIRQVGGQFFDAFISKDPAKSLANFGLSEARNVGRTLGGNAAVEVFKNNKGFGLNNAIKGQTEDDGNGGQKLTQLGRILAGTPFGVDTQKLALDKQINVTQRNVDVTQKLVDTNLKLLGVFTGDTSVDAANLSSISAVQPLIGLGLSQASGASGPLAQVASVAQALGLGGTGSAGSSSPLSGIGSSISKFLGLSGSKSSAPAGGAPAGEDDEGRSLLEGNIDHGAFKTQGGRSSIAGGLFANNTTNSEKALSAVGTAGVLFGAEQGVAAGIKQGGAKGTIGAITSVAGAAAALDPEPISKAILAGVALVGGIVGGFFGDPKQQRADQITNKLNQNKYQGPETLNRDETFGGNDIVRNKYGQVSDSGFADLFSGTAATQNRYKGTYYQTPGSIQEVYQAGYNGLSQPQGQTINLTVQALDSQSILDRSADIGAAVNKELINGSPVGLTIQQKVLGA